MKLLRVQKPLPIYALALRISALYMLFYVALLQLAASVSQDALETLTALMPVAVGSMAAWMAWMAWRASHPWQKKAWLWLLTGLALWTGAEINWAIGVWLAAWPVWIANIFWLAGYIPLALSCITFLRTNHFALTPLKEVIAVIGGGLLPMLIFVNFVHPLRNTQLFEIPTELVIGALYPALDIVIATGGLLCLMTSGSKPWLRPWFYIGIALTLFAYTDMWYWLLDFFQIQEVSVANAIRVDVPYGLAYVILAIGCWQVMVEERASKTVPISIKDLPQPPQP